MTLKTISHKLGLLTLLLAISEEAQPGTITRFPDDYASINQGEHGWYYCWSLRGDRENSGADNHLKWVDARIDDYPVPGHDGPGYYEDAAFIRKKTDSSVIISPYSKNGIWPFLKWVSPKNGSGFSIVGTFRRTQTDLDLVGDGVNATIYLNGKEVFTTAIDKGDNEIHDFDLQIGKPLTKGDVVQFVVNPRGNDFFDNVEVKAEITSEGN